MRGYRSRRAIAIVACALWLLGVEALPDLHLAAHGDDHTHAEDGTIVHAGAHRHGDVVHSHAKPKPRAKRIPVQLAFDRVPFAHDAAGIGHHAIALHAPAAPLLAPLPVDRPSLLVDHPAVSIAAECSLHRPQARGPPA